MMQSRTQFPTSFLTELRQWIARRERGMRCALPAMIESYDPSTCTASVKPLVSNEYEGGVIEELGVINEVPVVFPRSKDFIFSFPLQRGDGVLLVFSDFSLDAWKAASSGQNVNPGDTRTHHLSDAVAIPGLFNQTVSNPVADPSAVTIKFKDAALVIGTDGTVKIGKEGGPLKAVATEDFVDDVVASLATGTGHTHTAPSGGGPTTGPILGLLPTGKPNYKTTKVSLE